MPRVYDRFDAVVLLSAPLDVIEARIRSRTTNKYGKRVAERELIHSDFHTVEPLLGATSTHEIDATGPVGEVVQALVGIAQESQAVDG